MKVFKQSKISFKCTQYDAYGNFESKSVNEIHPHADLQELCEEFTHFVRSIGYYVIGGIGVIEEEDPKEIELIKASKRIAILERALAASAPEEYTALMNELEQHQEGE